MKTAENPPRLNDPSFIPSTEQEYIDCVDWQIRQTSHEAYIELIRACGSSSTKGIELCSTMYECANLHLKQLCELLKEPVPSSASPWRAAYHAFWMGRAIQSAGMHSFRAYATENGTYTARAGKTAGVQTRKDKMREDVTSMHLMIGVTDAAKDLAPKHNVSVRTAIRYIGDLFKNQ